jgi:hypothetical protein
VPSLAQHEPVVFLGEMRFSLGKPTGIEISLSRDENVNNDQALWACRELLRTDNHRHYIQWM